MIDCYVLILAGGKGERLCPLTSYKRGDEEIGIRAKPAVPFGGKYRIGDIVLSNVVNSGFLKIGVATQTNATSFIKHIQKGWIPRMGSLGFIEILPAQQRVGEFWYRGTADAVYQNISSIKSVDPDLVAVLGGDHIYKMDYSQMVDYHRSNNADLTISLIPCKIDEILKNIPENEGLKRFPYGVVVRDKTGRIRGFQEKPLVPKESIQEIEGMPGYCWVSMGNYIFNAAMLIEETVKESKKIVVTPKQMAAELEKNQNARETLTTMDFGSDLIPRLLKEGKIILGYNFWDNKVPGASEREKGYWKDVGTIDEYFNAHMDLVSVLPVFDLHNKKWTIKTWVGDYPPEKTVHDVEGRRGISLSSLVSEGCVISGGRIKSCILSPDVHVHSYSNTENSIVFSGTHIGQKCEIRMAILEKDTNVGEGSRIGIDPLEERIERARRKGIEDKKTGTIFVTEGTFNYAITPSGITVTTKGSIIPPGTSI